MQENDFEKKVEDKLSGLKLPPSATVWAAVEAELHKKKKRRVIFFIFLLAGLALAGYTGYTLLDTSSKTSLAHEKNLPLNNENNNPTKHEENINNPVNDHANKSKSAVDKSHIDNGEVSTITASKEEKVKQPEIKSSDKASSLKKETIAIKDKKDQKVYNKKERLIKNVTVDQKEIFEEKTKNKKEQENIVDNILKPDQQKDIVQKDDPVQPGNTKTSDLNNDADKTIGSEVKKEDTVAVTDTMKAHAAVDSASADLTKEELAQSKKIAAKKIKWGLDFSGGATFNRNKAFSVANTGRIFADRSYYNNAPVTSGAPQGAIEPPSSVSTGIAFKVGVFAEKSLSKRSSVTAGLRYAYLSEKMRIGNYKDTFFVTNSYFSNATNNGFYGPTRQKRHTNSYHFIELPVSYQLRLNKSAKMQLLWNAGFTAAYLLNTNALVYDTTAGGIYYKQPDVINRLHFNLHTGLSFRFATKRNFAWSIGPELSLDMTRLMKQDLFTRERYLFYGGLSAKIFLPSLKK